MRMLIAWLVICLSGCQIVYYPENTQPQPTQPVVTCKPFVYPRISNIPDVPDIPQSKLKDKGYTDTILINKIDELRKYAADLQHQFYIAYKEHTNSCR